MRPRLVVPVASLARLGFVDVDMARRLLSTPELAPIIDDAEVLNGLAAAPDPDLALLSLDRLLEHAADADRLVATLERDPVFRLRLFSVLGMSTAFGDHLARHPDHWHDVADLPLPAPRRSAQDVRRELLSTRLDDADRP